MVLKDGKVVSILGKDNQRRTQNEKDEEADKTRE